VESKRIATFPPGRNCGSPGKALLSVVRTFATSAYRERAAVQPLPVCHRARTSPPADGAPPPADVYALAIPCFVPTAEWLFRLRRTVPFGLLQPALTLPFTNSSGALGGDREGRVAWRCAGVRGGRRPA